MGAGVLGATAAATRTLGAGTLGASTQRLLLDRRTLALGGRRVRPPASGLDCYTYALCVCRDSAQGALGEHVFISLQELELRDVRFDVKIPPGEIDFDGEIRHSSPLQAQGEARLLNRSLGEIRVEGDLSVVLDAACDRCLEAIHFPIENHFDLVYMPADEAAAVDEQETGQAGIEVGYYEGGRLAVDEMLREVALLALPMRLVCSETCKGICPTCGRNRNQSDCACARQAADERWSQLKSFRSEVGPNS